MTEKTKLKSSVKYPTSIIVRGNDFLAAEIAKSLIDQGGYVIVIDHDIEKTKVKYESIEDKKLLSIIDFTSIDFLDEDLRRVDYVFFLGHQYDNAALEISSQEFLQASNYLDLMLNLAKTYDAKFVLTSSVKSHQVLTSSSELDINLGQGSKKIHSVYTQMEVQRYAEALVLESVEKINLNARIARLGKVIGPGMEFDLQNSFDKLIFQSIKSKDLEVKSDGLETNLYVHVLDAAYGVIKATFTKGTEGKIFTISNEEEVTDLSIAYKLQELTGLSREIRFLDSKDSFPPVRFYKPAPNLTTIGWMPRISFKRALVQVLDYATKLFLEPDVESEFEGITGDEDFYEAEQLDPTEEPKGALARLIAERKAQEKARRGSILMATQKARTKAKGRRKLSTGEKIERKIRKIYDGIASKFNFLKKITIVEAFMYLIFFIIFVFVYIQLISPAFVIGRDLLRIEYYQKQLNKEIDAGNYNEVSFNINKIDSLVGNVYENIDKFEPLYKLAGEEDSYSKTRESLQYLKLYSNSIKDVYSISDNFNNYWEKTDLGIVYKPNSESLLTISQAAVEKTPENYELVKGYEMTFDQTQDKVDLTATTLAAHNEGKFARYDLEKLKNDLLKIRPLSINNLSLMNVYTTILFTSNVQTYAVIIQDNSRYTPSGGYPAALGYIQVRDGKIINIYLSAFDDVDNLPITNIDATKLREINLSKPDQITASQVTFSDLFLIKDRAKLVEEINQIYSSRFSVEPRGVVFMDLQTVGELLEITGPIEINQVKVENDTLLNAIEILQGAEKSNKKRNEIIANIFANEVIKISENKSLIYQAANNNSFVFESDDVDLEKRLGIEEATNEYNWIRLAASIDPQETEIKNFPSINLKVEDLVGADLKITRTVNISAGSTNSMERIVVCMPPSSKNFTFSGGELDLGQAFSQDEVCVAGELGANQSASFSYSASLGLIDNLENNEYNINLEFRKAPGVDITYDYEAYASSGMQVVVDDNSGLILSNQKVISSGGLNNNKIINFKVKK